jgi:outer membrane protein assembly factor BamB
MQPQRHRGTEANLICQAIRYRSFFKKYFSKQFRTPSRSVAPSAPLCLCGLILFFVSTTRADFRFIHESDPHVNSPTGNGSDIPVDSACWAEMDHLNPKPAFIVDTGDVADHGLASEYATYRKFMAADLPDVPHYIAMGNHDQRWNPLGKEGFIRGVGQPLWQSWNYQGIHFVTLDATVLLEHWGHFDQAELDWLKKDLSKISKDMPLIIGFHHWIGREPVMVDNEQALLDIVKPYNIRLWLQGHGHSDIQWNINGVPAIMEKGLYQGSYTVIDVDTTHGVMKLTRRHWAKPNPHEQLLTDDATPHPRAVAWTELMTIPLARQPEPKWSDKVKLAGDTLQITIRHGDLPDTTQFAYRLDQSAYQPLDNDTKPSIAKLCAGHHEVTVQAMLADGRAFESPTDLLITRPTTPKPVWQTSLGSAVLSHLVRNGDGLYISTMSGNLFRLNPKTGKIAWKFHASGSLFSTPCVDGKTLFVGSVDHNLYAVNTDSGKEIWHHPTGASILAGPAAAHDVVAIVSTDQKVYGLDSADGSVKWTSQVQGMYQSNAATDGEHFFIGGWDNRVRCLDAATGKEIWTKVVGRNKKTGTVEFPYSPAIASPAVGDGKVFIVSDDGILHAINIADGKMLWEDDEKNIGYSGACYHDGVVYCAVSEHGNVIAADAKTGKIIWRNKTGSDIYDSSFAYGNGSVFIASVDGIFNRIDAATGKIIWQYALGPGHALCSPAVDDSCAYISSMSGIVTAMPAKTISP